MTQPFYKKSTLEKDIEKKAKAFARRRGWCEYKLTSPSTRGFPDRFYARGGEVRLVEWKKDENSKPTELQLDVHENLRNHGVKVYVMHNLAEFMELFE